MPLPLTSSIPFLNPTETNLVRWSQFLALFEVLSLVRYYALNEPIDKISPMLGTAPNQHMTTAFFIAIGILGTSRLIFSLRPRDRSLAWWAAVLHTLEILPVTFLYVLNVFPKLAEAKNLEERGRQSASILVYLIILSNAVIFCNWYTSLGGGDSAFLSRSPSRRLSASVSVAREPSVPVSATKAPAKKTTTKRAGSSSKKGSAKKM